MLFKVEELNVPIYSVEYGRECTAQAAYSAWDWSMFSFLKVFWTLTEGQWKAMTVQHVHVHTHRQSHK